MSLKLKTLCILLVLIIVYVAVHGAIHRFIFMPGFLYLEQREAEKNLHRSVEALKREMYHLSNLAHDWSSWDDTYHFISTRDPHYIRSNLAIETFQMHSLNLLYFCDRTGKVVWGRTLDHVNGKDITIPDIPGGSFPLAHPFLDIKPGSEAATGLIETERGPLMIASRHVLKSDNMGPSRGTLIMGRLLTQDVISELNVQTDVVFDITSMTRNHDKNKNPWLSDLREGRKQHHMDSGDKQKLYLYSALNDITGKPAFLFKVTMNRDLLKKGRETLHYSMVSLIAAGSLILLLMLGLMHITILNPLAVLTRHTIAVEETGDLSTRLDFQRDDEIGVLAQRFDRMLLRLSEVQNELLDQSYYSGLAGVTSDLLHHSGNILMPMSQKTNRLLELCRSIPRANIHNALDELEKGAADLDREKSLKRFLSLSVLEMEKTFDQAEAVLCDLAEHSRELEHLMSGLEKYSRGGSAARGIVPETLFQDAVARMPDHLKKACPVRIHPDVKNMETFKSEPLILVQVISTLLCHAVECSKACDPSNAEVILNGHTDTNEGKRQVRITVTGNGTRQDSGHLKNMFARRSPDRTCDSFFSGLHWCSNVAAAMNGDLSVTSSDAGTVFKLVLPQGGEA